MSKTSKSSDAQKIPEIIFMGCFSLLGTTVGQIGTIIVAVITVWGGLCASGITCPPPAAPAPTISPTVSAPSSQTVEPPSTHTSTPVSAILTSTATLQPTRTFTPSVTSPPKASETPIPTLVSTALPLNPGEDWKNDCISSVWSVFSKDRLLEKPESNCWPQPVNGAFSTYNKNFQVFGSGSTSTAYYSGIIIDLPTPAEIRFRLRLNQITTSEAELWFMILSANDPYAEGIKIGSASRSIQPGKMKFDFIAPGVNFRTDFLPTLNSDYLFTIEVASGNVRVTINSASYGPFPISFMNRKFFIGYRPLSAASYWIDATILDFQLDGAD